MNATSTQRIFSLSGDLCAVCRDAFTLVSAVPFVAVGSVKRPNK